MHAKRKIQTGFTLIEVMITLTIAGLLAALAYPSYNRYVLQSYRTQAQGHLLQTAYWLERASLATGRYPTHTQQAEALATLQAQWSDTRYAIHIDSPDGHSFVLTATPQNSQSKDVCGTLTLSHTGQRGIRNLPKLSAMTAAQCWPQ